MKILIIGGSGFVGKYLSKELSKAGFSIIATYNSSQFPLKDDKKLMWKKLDLKNSFNGILEGIDIVINLSTVHSLVSPSPVISDYIDVNISAVNKLCQEAISAGVKKLIHFSSISAVGKFNGEKLREITLTNQPDLYGLSKFAGEQIVVEYSKKINSIILRPPGIVGEGYFLCWIGRVLNSLINNQNIVAYNENSLFNNIIGLEDILRLILDIINTQNYSGIYNLAAKRPMRLGEIINHMRETAGSKSNISYDAHAKSSFEIDISRLLEVGFNPGSTLDIVEKYVKQNLNNIK